MSNKPQYWGASGGLEYEAAWALGAANGVRDLETLQYVTMLCNEEGIDPISFGATLGAVMELYEMGVLTSGFKPFPLDVAGLHLQPKVRLLVGPSLRTHAQFTLSAPEGIVCGF